MKSQTALRSALGYPLALLLWVTIFFDPIVPVLIRFGLITLLGIAGFMVWISNRPPHSKRQNQLIFLLLITGGFAFSQIINSALNKVDLALAAPYLGLLFLPPLLILGTRLMGVRQVLDAMLPISSAFAIIVIIISWLFYIFPDLFALAISAIADGRGMYGSKATLTGDAVANIYFPATLLLIPAGTIALAQRRWFIYFCNLIALIMAFSRFGVFVLLGYTLIHVLNIQNDSCQLINSERVKYGFLTKKRRFFQIAMVTVVLLVGSVFFLIYGKNLSNDGFSIRQKHLESIVAEFSNKPVGLLTGFGAGSEFYSSGFEQYTDNIEISQLEVLRKYGILGFLLIHLFLIRALSLAKLKRTNLPGLFSAIACFYVVAASNPVLLSSGGILLYILPHTRQFED